MSSNEKVSCDDIREQLIGFLGRELSNDDYALVEEHLYSCLSCKSILKDLESVSSLLGSAPTVELKKDFAYDIEILIGQSASINIEEPIEAKAVCDEVNDLLSPYYDKELDEDKYRLVESHLADCESCSMVLSNIQAVSRVLTGLPREALGYDLSESIEDLLANSKKPAKLLPFRGKIFVTSSVAASVLLIVVLSFSGIINSSKNEFPTVAHKKLERTIEVSSAVAEAVPEKKLQPVHRTDKGVDKTSTVASSTLVEKNSPPGKLTAKVDSQVDVEEKRIKDVASNKVALTSPAKVAPDIGKRSLVVKEPIQSPQEMLLSTEAVVAYESDDADDLFSQMGVSTNEDGLYAIKL